MPRVKGKTGYRGYKATVYNPRGRNFVGRGAAMRDVYFGAKRGAPGKVTVARTRGWAGANTEMKYFDSFKNSTNLTATVDWSTSRMDPGTLDTLFVPIQGDDIINRTGRKVKILHIKIRGQVRMIAGATTGAEKIRIVLACDKQTNAAAALGSSIFGVLSGAPAAENGVNIFMNAANFGRFTILKDKTFISQPPETAGNYRMFNFKFTWKGEMMTHFNTTNGGTIADIVDNSLHLYANCNDVTSQPQIAYFCRVGFVDA